MSFETMPQEGHGILCLLRLEVLPVWLSELQWFVRENAKLAFPGTAAGGVLVVLKECYVVVVEGCKFSRCDCFCLFYC